MATCANCGKEISIGDEYYASKTTGDNCYCCAECMKEDLKDRFFDEVVEDWFDDYAECYEEEAEDPYDRYGVSRSDF